MTGAVNRGLQSWSVIASLVVAWLMLPAASAPAQGREHISPDAQAELFRMVADSLTRLLAVSFREWDAESILVDDQVLAAAWGMPRERIAERVGLMALSDDLSTRSSARWSACWAKRRPAGIECPARRRLLIDRAPVIRTERDGTFSVTAFLRTGLPQAFLDGRMTESDDSPAMMIGASLRRMPSGKYRIIRLNLIGH
jgi:hypothetical protein